MNKRLKKFIIPLAIAMASTFLAGINTKVVHADNAEYQSVINVYNAGVSMKSMSYDDLMSGAVKLSDDLTMQAGGTYRYASSYQAIPRDGQVYYVQTGNITLFYKYIGVEPYSGNASDAGLVQYVVYTVRFKDKVLDGYGGCSYSERNQSLYDQLTDSSQLFIPPIKPSGKNYTVKRLSGDTVFDTCEAIANDFSTGTVENVIVASGLDYPDALSGTVLAKKKNAPILLVKNNPNDSTQTIDYIQKHLDKKGTIYILGGEASVSSDFINKFQSMGFTNIKRLAGQDRYATCNAVNSELNFKGQQGNVFIVSGNGYADGLTVGAIAGQMSVPIFLSDTNSISDETLQKIKDINPSEIDIVGGTGVISDDVRSQIKNCLGSSCDVRIYSGKDRYETSELVWATFRGVFTGNTACLVSGEDFADALAGTALADKYNVPIILVNSDINSTSMRNDKEDIDATKWDAEIILGDENHIDENTVNFFKQ